MLCNVLRVSMLLIQTTHFCWIWYEAH